LGEELHLRVQEAGDVSGAGHPGTADAVLERRAAPEFEGRGDRRGLRGAYAMDAGERREIRRGKPAEPVAFAQQAAGDLEHALASGAGAKQDREQFLALERGRSESLQAFAGTFRLGKLGDADL